MEKNVLEYFACCFAVTSTCDTVVVAMSYLNHWINNRSYILYQVRSVAVCVGVILFLDCCQWSLIHVMSVAVYLCGCLLFLGCWFFFFFWSVVNRTRVTIFGFFFVFLQEGGANVIELGVPFTDPQADGATIQGTNQVRGYNIITSEAILWFPTMPKT